MLNKQNLVPLLLINNNTIQVCKPIISTQTRTFQVLKIRRKRLIIKFYSKSYTTNTKYTPKILAHLNSIKKNKKSIIYQNIYNCLYNDELINFRIKISNNICTNKTRIRNLLNKIKSLSNTQYITKNTKEDYVIQIAISAILHVIFLDPYTLFEKDSNQNELIINIYNIPDKKIKYIISIKTSLKITKDINQTLISKLNNLTNDTAFLNLTNYYLTKYNNPILTQQPYKYQFTFIQLTVINILRYPLIEYIDIYKPQSIH